jgi:hypothetical protein
MVVEGCTHDRAVIAGQVLFADELALTRDALVSFRRMLDPILNLAVALGQPFGHDVAAGWRAPAHACCQTNALTYAISMLWH